METQRPVTEPYIPLLHRDVLELFRGALASVRRALVYVPPKPGEESLQFDGGIVRAK